MKGGFDSWLLPVFWAAGVKSTVNARVVSLGWVKSLSRCWSFTSSLSAVALGWIFQKPTPCSICFCTLVVNSVGLPQVVRCLHAAKQLCSLYTNPCGLIWEKNFAIFTISRTLHLFLVQWWTDEGITNNNVKLEELYCWCVNHQKGIFVSLQPLQTNNNSSCMFQSVNKLMLNSRALIGFMDLLVVVLNVIHNALHMHFWCYRKIEQAYSLHFPSPQEPSLLLVFSLRELIGLNVAEWSVVFFPSPSYFLVWVMRAQKSLMLFCCCYLEGPVRSIGDRREDNQDKDKPRKVRSLLPQGPCTCEVYQQKTCLRWITESVLI